MIYFKFYPFALVFKIHEILYTIFGHVCCSRLEYQVLNTNSFYSKKVVRLPYTTGSITPIPINIPTTSCAIPGSRT